MKKLLTVMAVTILASSYAHATDESFNVTMKLFKPIQITETHALDFGNQNITGSAFDVVVATGDGGAAAFTATGGKNRNVARSVVESSINMTSGTDTIAVDTFTVAGPTVFDGSGNITGLKVGATAHVLAGSVDGDYTGSATFRLVYN